jgi:hypothetical protein
MNKAERKEEAEAWRVVAEEYDAGRTATEYLCLDLKYSGIERYYRNRRLAAIPLTLRMRMVDRVEAALLFGYGPAYGENGIEEHGGRVLACLLFSEMAKDGATVE